MKINGHFISTGLENFLHSFKSTLNSVCIVHELLLYSVASKEAVFKIACLSSLSLHISGEPALRELYLNFLHWTGCRFASLFVKKDERLA